MNTETIKKFRYMSPADKVEFLSGQKLSRVIYIYIY